MTEREKACYAMAEKLYDAGYRNVKSRMNDIEKVIELLKYYLETNEEKGVVYFPKSAIEKAICRLQRLLWEGEE